jgi:hypothetical protein
MAQQRVASEVAHVLADLFQEAGFATTNVQGLTVISLEGQRYGSTFTVRRKRGHKQFANLELVDRSVITTGPTPREAKMRGALVEIYVASSSTQLGDDVATTLSAIGYRIVDKGSGTSFPVMRFYAVWPS